SLMENKTVTVDVREDIRSGREPFSKIMKAAAALQADERMLLLAPFEPVPLFRFMEKQGFAHTGQATAFGDWEVLFTRTPNTETCGSRLSEPQHAGAETRVPSNSVPEIPPTRCGSASRDPAQIVEVDARGLEPPQPMVKILEALSVLPPGAA